MRFVLAGLPRQLLQESNEILEVTNEREFFDSLSDAEVGTEIFIDSGRIQLIESLEINSSQVILRGRPGGETVILCPEGLANGMIIRGDLVAVQDLVFSGCTQASAMVIESGPSIRNQSLTVNLTRVSFVGNGLQEGQLIGAGLQIRSCFNSDCIRPTIYITSSVFEQNTGLIGGGIYAEDCQLVISGSVFAHNTAARNGGAIYINSGRPSLELVSTTFENNTARGILPSGTNLPNSLPFLEEIDQGTGGALLISSASQVHIRNCSFLSNKACQGGGGLNVRTRGLTVGSLSFNFSVINSSFVGNLGHCHEGLNFIVEDHLDSTLQSGGALLYKSTGNLDLHWSIFDSTFENNSAIAGGGIYIWASPAQTHFINSSGLIENHALLYGGGLFVRSGELFFTDTKVHSNRAINGGGIMIYSGANFLAPSNLGGSQSRTIFSRNKAIYGGGIYYARGGLMQLDRTVFRKNIAYRHGGGFSCYQSNDPISFNGATFRQNRALVGGAISYTTGGNLTVDDYEGIPTKFIKNTASVGGGIYYAAGHTIFVWLFLKDAQFLQNRAIELGDKIIRRLRDVEESMGLQNITTRTGYGFRPDQTDPVSTLQRLTQVPQGHGGGLCLAVDSIRLFTYAEVFLNGTLFQENEAKIGGGMDIHIKDHHWNAGTEVYCFRITFAVYTCQRFVFQNVSIVQNTALYAGGLFTTNAKTILLTCDRSAPRNNQTLLERMMQKIHSTGEVNHEEEDVCFRIENNVISDGARMQGADVGSSAASLFLPELQNSLLREVASGEKLSVPCRPEEDKDCQERMLRVVVRDAFNQTIVRGIEDASLDVIIVSENVLGDLRYTAQQGEANIDNLRAWGIASNAVLTIQHGYDDSIRVQTSFSTRSCLPGEFTGDKVCEKCPPDQYGFNASFHKCQMCENHAHCTGGSALVPVSGYWHSTPFSPQFHRCFLLEACDFEARIHNLTTFYRNISRVEEGLLALDLYIQTDQDRPEFPLYDQCREGYHGILCGSCEEGYGKSFNGECRECPEHKSVAGVLAALAVFWTFILVGINCVITLASTRARIHLVLFELRKQSTINRRPVLERAPPVGETSQASTLERSVTVSTQPSEVEEPDSVVLLGQQLVATVQLTETLKVLVNYLQVTSAALRLQIEWSDSLNGLLSVQSALVGFGSESLNAPFDCNFEKEDEVPPSIIALWLRILTPFIVLCALIMVFTILWYVCLKMGWKPLEIQQKKKSSTSTHSSWLTCVVVIIIVTIYFSYIDITRELLRTVNCIHVDQDQVDSDSNPYHKYALDRGHRFWVEDTTMVCFKGDHKSTGIAGIVGLSLSFTVIVFIIVWLPLNHQHRKNPHFIARYWFIYQAYKRQWYTCCWEAVILIRKALIATIVVFAYHLGPNLQAALCVGVLICAYSLHNSFRPFKVEEEHQNVPDYFGSLLTWMHAPKLATLWIQWNNTISLNGLESTSLVCSALVFFIGIVVSDSTSSSIERTFLTVVGMLINGVFLFYVAFRLYSGLHMMLDLRLELADPAFMATEPNGGGMKQLIKKAYRLAQAHRKKARAHDSGIINYSR